MLYHPQNSFIGIHRYQLNLGIFILEHPENFICESLSHKINPGKI